MKQYYRYDENGYYKEPVIADYSEENPMPDDVTEVRPPDGLYRAWFDKDQQTWLETGSPPEPDIEALKQAKLTELNTACQNTIYAGVGVETSDGMKHFNLTDHDQINLSGYSNAITAARAGQPSMVDLTQGVWYKADGEGEHHRYWSVDDFQKIIGEAFAFKAGELTYLDELKTYVRGLQTAEEVNAVCYGTKL